jgi:hypothetical protein
VRLELAAVELRARRIQDARAVDPRARVPIRTVTLSGAAGQRREREREHGDPHGPWTSETSYSAPGPWQVAHASAPDGVVLVAAWAATYG